MLNTAMPAEGLPNRDTPSDFAPPAASADRSARSSRCAWAPRAAHDQRCEPKSEACVHTKDQQKLSISQAGCRFCSFFWMQKHREHRVFILKIMIGGMQDDATKLIKVSPPNMATEAAMIHPGAASPRDTPPAGCPSYDWSH